MPMTSARPSVVALAALLAVASVLMAGGAAVDAARVKDLLPDLQMAPIYGVQLQSKNGDLRLRFGTLVNNIGDGPVIVRGSGPVGSKMTRVVQRIRRTTGRARGVLQPQATMYFESVGVHGHWHLRDFVTMRLISLSTANPSPDRVSTKIGFCFYDTTRLAPDDRPPNSARRTFTGCGHADSTRVRMGISVGWGDAYEPSYQFQAIDVSRLKSGLYRLCSTVNPQRLWLEKSAANNSSWVDLRFNAARKTIEIVGSETSPC